MLWNYIMFPQLSTIQKKKKNMKNFKAPLNTRPPEGAPGAPPLKSASDQSLVF